MKKIIAIALVVAGTGLLLYTFLFSGTTGDLRVNIQPATYIMPAAYKVYANEDVLGGRYNLFKAVVQNDGGSIISNMKVEYRIPKYIDGWTEAQAPNHVLPGQSVVVMGYPSFERSIIEKNTQSREKAEIRITYGPKGNQEEHLESFTFTMMSVNDFAYTDLPASEIASYSDLVENNPLSACFVTAEDPVIQYYTSKIQREILGGEAAGVNRTSEESIRFLQGIYEATLQSKMVYSSTPSVPSNTGDVSTIVQRIRLPRDVVTGNTGLCIELSFLYASVLRNAGLEPILYYVPGHAYPGFRLDGQYYAIEATGIGGQGLGGSLSANDALKKGMEQLQEFFRRVQMGDERYSIVDINECFKQGIIPMELRDDAFAKQKIDEYAGMWYKNNNMLHTASGNTQQYASETVPASHAQYARGVRFSYPRNWQVMRSPMPQVPMLVAMVTPPGSHGGVEIYDLPGVNDVRKGMDYLQSALNSFGLQASYRQEGTHNGYVLVSGTTYSANGQFDWYGAFRCRGGRFEGITIPAETPQAQQILSSLN